MVYSLDRKFLTKIAHLGEEAICLQNRPPLSIRCVIPFDPALYASIQILAFSIVTVKPRLMKIQRMQNSGTKVEREIKEGTTRIWRKGIQEKSTLDLYKLKILLKKIFKTSDYVH